MSEVNNFTNEKIEVERQLQALREYNNKKKMIYEARLNKFLKIYPIDGYENDKNLQKFSDVIKDIKLDDLRVIQKKYEKEKSYWESHFVREQCEEQLHSKIKDFLKSMEKEISKQMNQEIGRIPENLVFNCKVNARNEWEKGEYSKINSHNRLNNSMKLSGVKTNVDLKVPKNVGAVTVGIKELYEGKVGVEAFLRAGNNKNLHGIVHEVLYRDAQNMNPMNIAKGVQATLSKSATAVRDDVILKQAGKVVGRAQLKDTANSIGHTVKQVASGKYRGTTLMGTKETVKAYSAEVAKVAAKGIKVTQKMNSTGVSSADTVRIASKTLGSNLTSKALTSAAKSSGVAGAVVSGGVEVISAGKELFDGKIDGGEFTARVAKETAGGGLSAAAGGMAATAVATTTAGILATTAAPVWVPAAIGVGAAIAVGSAVKGIWDCMWE